MPPEPVLSERVLQDTAAVFGLLSTPVRVHIVWLLANGDRDVGTLAEETGQSLATVSHHLGKLKLAGLVRAVSRGRHRVYVVDYANLVELVRAAVANHVDSQPVKRSRRSG
jgi:DNA-binding transcriptional ArsR family regulator